MDVAVNGHDPTVMFWLRNNEMVNLEEYRDRCVENLIGIWMGKKIQKKIPEKKNKKKFVFQQWPQVPEDVSHLNSVESFWKNPGIL